MRENMLGITDSPHPSVCLGKLYCIGVENISDAPQLFKMKEKSLGRIFLKKRHYTVDYSEYLLESEAYILKARLL